MSCVTCEITPPPERQSATRAHEGHIGHRFGDGGLGWQITFNGRNVTLQTVEALAGDHKSGWVEMHLLNGDGAPTLHPEAELTCPACGGPREPVSTEPWLGDSNGGTEHWPVCATCGSSDRPTRAYDSHPVTVIRRGAVQVIHGTHILSPEQADGKAGAQNRLDVKAG